MIHVTRQTFHELSVLLTSGQRLIDSLTEKTRRLNHIVSVCMPDTVRP